MRKFTRAVAIQLFFILLLGAAFVLAARQFPVVEWIQRTEQRLGQLGFWGAVLYPLLLAGCNLLLLPGGVITIGSGLFFGLWWGFSLVWAGSVLGAAAAFWISRLLGRGWVERRVEGSRKWSALDAAIAREGWKIVVLSQVHPLFPTSILNYIYGVTKVRFWPCMAWVAIGQAPGLFLYGYLGTLAQHGVRLLRGKSHPHLVEYLVWIGGLLVTVMVTTALARLALKVMREVENPANDSSPNSAPAPDRNPSFKPEGQE